MITLQELCQHLDTLLEPELFDDFCPNGLQVEGKTDVKTVATAVSASLETIQQAIKQSVDALIVHHGLFWKGDSYVICGSKKKKLKLLLENGISLIAYHLPLDAHQEVGNNWRAAKEMGWTDLEPFSSIGVKGLVPKVSPSDFQKTLETFYDHPAHTALGGGAEISSCALISGGAYKCLTEAKGAACDAFITGNFDEPAWHQAFEEKIHFFALGHSATERVGPKALREYLETTFPIRSLFLDVPNPF